MSGIGPTGPSSAGFYAADPNNSWQQEMNLLQNSLKNINTCIQDLQNAPPSTYNSSLYIGAIAACQDEVKQAGQTLSKPLNNLMTDARNALGEALSSAESPGNGNNPGVFYPEAAIPYMQDAAKYVEKAITYWNTQKPS